MPSTSALFPLSFLIDTWQFFLHKLMHEVPFLYRNFHSHHHRLYVPYAFGALYNHPVEGFLLDTLGATIAEAASAMTVRQKILLFGFASLKTVDDHSGYRIWWDPMQVSAHPSIQPPAADTRSLTSFSFVSLQLLFSNNADYHDIHHQSFGIKSNFSSVSTPLPHFCLERSAEPSLTPPSCFRQPFFTRWDIIFNTVMTRDQVNNRKRPVGASAEAEIEAVQKLYHLD